MGKSPDERKEQWLTHFRNLLGTPDENPPIENIPLIYENTIIDPLFYEATKVAFALAEAQSHKSLH